MKTEPIICLANQLIRNSRYIVDKTWIAKSWKTEKNPSIIIGKNVSKVSEKPNQRSDPFSLLLYFNYSATSNVTDTPYVLSFSLVQYTKIHHVQNYEINSKELEP